MLLHPISYHYHKNRLYSGSTLYFATARQSQQNCPRSSFQNCYRHSQVQGLTQGRNLKNRRVGCSLFDLRIRRKPYCRHFPLPTDRPPVFRPPHLPYPVGLPAAPIPLHPVLGFPYFRQAYSVPGCDSVSNYLYRRHFAAYHFAPRLHFWDYPLLPHRHCLYFLPKPPPYLDRLFRRSCPEYRLAAHHPPPPHLSFLSAAPLPRHLRQQQGRQVLTACPPT